MGRLCESQASSGLFVVMATAGSVPSNLRCIAQPIVLDLAESKCHTRSGKKRSSSSSSGGSKENSQVSTVVLKLSFPRKGPLPCQTHTHVPQNAREGTTCPSGISRRSIDSDMTLRRSKTSRNSKNSTNLLCMRWTVFSPRTSPNCSSGARSPRLARLRV